MWTSLTLAAAFSMVPGQTAALTLGNARVTYGELGPSRPDTKLLPGDIFFLSFDIDGIKVDDTGKVSYSMEMEVNDKAGKPIFKQQAVDRNDFLPLGGTKLPARAFVSIGPDQEAGTYVCKVTVTDRATRQKQTLEKSFDVLPKSFGLVQVYTSSDSEGKVPTSTIGVAGQSVWVHFALVGFERGKETKQPNVVVDMVVLTKQGSPTLPKPTSVTIDNGVEEKDTGIPLRFLLPLNRAGEFNVELKATDALTKKTSRVVLPISVMAGNQ